jgi:hypothetical protein
MTKSSPHFVMRPKSDRPLGQMILECVPGTRSTVACPTEITVFGKTIRVGVDGTVRASIADFRPNPIKIPVPVPAPSAPAASEKPSAAALYFGALATQQLGPSCKSPEVDDLEKMVNAMSIAERSTIQQRLAPFLSALPAAGAAAVRLPINAVQSLGRGVMNLTKTALGYAPAPAPAPASSMSAPAPASTVSEIDEDFKAIEDVLKSPTLSQEMAMALKDSFVDLEKKIYQLPEDRREKYEFRFVLDTDDFRSKMKSSGIELELVLGEQTTVADTSGAAPTPPGSSSRTTQWPAYSSSNGNTWEDVVFPEERDGPRVVTIMKAYLEGLPRGARVSIDDMAKIVALKRKDTDKTSIIRSLSNPNVKETIERDGDFVMLKKI